MGPTNVKPRRFRSFASAIDSGVVAIAISTSRVSFLGRDAGAGSQRQKYAASEPHSAASSRARFALLIVGLDLAAVADDARVAEQPLDVARAHPRHAVEVEAVERVAERFALAQDREPGEPRLEPFEADLLEEAPVFADRKAPLLVVVGDVQRIVAAPRAAAGFDRARGHGAD